MITLKGLRCLEHAVVIAFPVGQGTQPGIAEQIIASRIGPHQQQLPLYFPYVQDEDQLQQAWRQAAQQVADHLLHGQDVAFACEGDVSFYSTFGYLAQTLKHQYPELPIQAIPGVCSPLAAAAARGWPMALRQQRLAILPALYQVEELEKTLAVAEVVVLMKVSSVYEQVWLILQKHGLLEQSYVVDRCSWPEEKIYTHLQHYPRLALSYFSILIVHVIGAEY